MDRLRLYDLVAADGRRFSPYCWRVKMALAHKGLFADTIPTRFTDIAKIADGRQTTVPVLDDRGRIIRDSFAIAEYLEDTHPDRPSLFGGPGGRATARFVESWALTTHGALSALVVHDIHECLDEADKAYFRSSREKRFGGRRLEEVQAGREERVAALRDLYLPLRVMLKSQPFIGGAAPLYADYIVFGTLMWPYVVSSFRLLAPDDPVTAWFERCLDLHGGFARGERAAAA